MGKLPVVTNGHEIEQFFGSASPLTTVLAGYSPRQEQLEMAQAVSDTLLTGGRLVVEAGTGTGKTLAYLIPVLLSGQRVIISTGTKTLQDQLYHRDLPVVAQVLGRPAEIVQLKGRANYLCLHRLELLGQDRESDVGRFDRQAYAEVSQWSRLTRSGDIAEVHGVPEDSGIWPLVTSTVENCLGAQCNFYEKCHLVSARQAATSADIVVVNHHLLLADLILKDEGFGELLPEFEAVIIDEAHQFPDIAQGFFNLSISSARMLDLLRDLQLEALSAGAHDQALEAVLDTTSKSVREARLLLPKSAADVPWRDIDPNFGGHMEQLTAGLEQLADWLVAVDESPVGLQRVGERLNSTTETLEQLLCGDETAGLRWLRLTRLGFTLNYTPIDVADSLNELVDAQPCAWVFTSATLAVGEDFGHFLHRMGMADVRTEQIPSPFDFSSAALLYLPPGLPDPGEAGYTDRVVEQLLPVLRASGGRAFLLFTSHRALRHAANLLENDPNFDLPLLVQGTAPRSRLLEQFVELDDPVLIGTTSFWEGVDIRGDSLVVVAIDKLPFASPGDPMLQARLEAISRKGGNPFRDFQLPQAALALKQGVGRLIRDYSDFGIVVICDPRLRTRSYGKIFLDSLPPMPVTDKLDAITAFFADRESDR